MTQVQVLRSLLAEGKHSIGSWLQLPSPDVAELLARSGYDWIVVDMEHGAISAAELPSIFRAIESGGAAPFVRVIEASQSAIKGALDAGAQGLVFPLIESYDQLNAAINHVLFPHSGGKRGIAYCRANAYGKEFDSYLHGLGNEIFIVAQVEHINALGELESIIGHPRLDAIMVGSYDLSGSMGITGDFKHPDFLEIMERITSTCKKYNVLMGTHIAYPDHDALAQCVTNGQRFIAYGIDSVFIWSAAARPFIC